MERNLKKIMQGKFPLPLPYSAKVRCVIKYVLGGTTIAPSWKWVVEGNFKVNSCVVE
jgi:hypothetical protein